MFTLRASRRGPLKGSNIFTWDLLERSWELLKGVLEVKFLPGGSKIVSWVPLGPSWEPLGASWARLGSCRRPLGSLFGSPVLGTLRAILGALGGVLGASWEGLGGILEPSWEVFGAEKGFGNHLGSDYLEL